MPNVDFERRLVPIWLAEVMSSPDSRRKLLTVKAKRDYEDQDIVRVNFLDTFRPELWCIEGLARHLDPLLERHYGLDLIENLPRISARFLNVPQEMTAWVLYVQVDADREIFDDSYFLKKVQDQIGFGSRQNIDVSITPGMEQAISINPVSDDDSETLAALTLAPGMNTVVVTEQDQRIGAWLLFTFLCNYLDRGYKAMGYAASIVEKEVFAKWSTFVLRDQQIVEIFGFQPDHEKFRTTLQSQYYQMHYDAASQSWYISPPIFRFDIIHPIDILEDYLVATGYDFEEIKPRVPARSTPTDYGTGSQTKRSELEERLVDYMQVYGAWQTVGLLLDSYENLVERMCHEGPPMVFFLFSETAFLDEKRVAHSQWKMGILLVGTDHPFNNAHTLLDALCYHLRLGHPQGMPLQLKRSNSQVLIPGRQVAVYVGDTPIGQFGEVHPEILTRWELFYPTSFIELDLDSITELWGGTKA